MSRTLIIPDSLYERLESTTYAHGMSSIEQLLEKWQSGEDELRHRQEVVDQIDALRECIFATYGEMSDSAAFQKLRLKRIVATTTYANAASMGVMRKLGMRIESNLYPDPPWLQIVGILENKLEVNSC
jgi:hypothetical protein